jgi:ammonia channel protein AmtB
MKLKDLSDMLDLARHGVGGVIGLIVGALLSAPTCTPVSKSLIPTPPGVPFSGPEACHNHFSHWMTDSGAATFLSEEVLVPIVICGAVGVLVWEFVLWVLRS